MIYRVLIFIFVFSNTALAQDDDTLPYNSYRDKVVLYGDIGFKAAPFNIRYNYPNGDKSLHFKHNFKPILGFGVAYKWFGLRLGIGLPLLLRDTLNFGKTTILDAGLKFNLKRMFWDIDIRYYKGYAIKDAYKWNDTLSKDANPHDIRPGTAVASFSINNWYFRNKKYNMKSVFGITGDFKRNIGTWFYKSGLSFFGVGNDSLDLVGSRSVIPYEMTDDTDKSKASSATAMDLLFVPGYAYSYRENNFQVSVFGGFGGAIQAKGWNFQGISKGHLGLVPRIDLRLVAGYSDPKYFVWFVSDFDFKSIGFFELKYYQTYYNLMIQGGIRLDNKEKKKKKSKRKDSR